MQDGSEVKKRLENDPEYLEAWKGEPKLWRSRRVTSGNLSRSIVCRWLHGDCISEGDFWWIPVASPECVDSLSKVSREAVKLLFQSSKLRTESVLCTVVYDTTEHVILDQVQTAKIGWAISKYVYNYFGTSKGTDKMEKRTLRSVNSLNPLNFFV